MRFVLLALGLMGCAPIDVVASVDAGRAQIDAGADASSLPEPRPGSVCDQQDDCAACMACSQTAHQACIGAALTCDGSADCVAAADCLGRCGDADAECVRGCASAHPAGASLVREIFRCGLCDACPADCRSYHALWCEEPPF